MNEDDIVIEADGREEGGSEEELEASESRADAKVAKIKKELEVAKKERQEYMDGWQRAKADYMNALKRFESEKASAVSLGTMTALAALLPAYDALARAKEHGEVPDGFEGISKQLESGFQSLGLTAIGAVGESFDPLKHEALGTDAVTDPKQDDTVTAVLEPGYAVKGVVVRPARVRVGSLAS